MKRRDFLKSSAGAGLAAGAAFSMGRYEDLLTTRSGNARYDMVAVKGGSPEAMFDLGIQELGGMGTFVKKGQKVLVKPNIGWDVVPEFGACTNPLLVTRVIEHVLRAGQKKYMYSITQLTMAPAAIRLRALKELPGMPELKLFRLIRSVITSRWRSLVRSYLRQ